eukprot:s176_g6.t3
MTLTPRSPKLEADSSSDLDGWHWADPPGEPPHADSQPPDTAVTNSAAAPPTVATDSQLSQFIFLVDYSRPTLMPGNNAIHTEPGDDNGSEKCDNASANFSQNCSKDSDQNSTGNAGGVWLNDSNLTAGGAFSLTYGVSTTVPVGPGSTSSFSGREHLSIQSESSAIAVGGQVFPNGSGVKMTMTFQLLGHSQDARDFRPCQFPSLDMPTTMTCPLLDWRDDILGADGANGANA